MQPLLHAHLSTPHRTCGERACSRLSAQRSQDFAAAAQPSESKLARHRGFGSAVKSVRPVLQTHAQFPAHLEGFL